MQEARVEPTSTSMRWSRPARDERVPWQPGPDSGVLAASAAAHLRIAERMLAGLHAAGETARVSVQLDDADREVVPVGAASQRQELFAVVTAPDTEGLRLPMAVVGVG